MRRYSNRRLDCETAFWSSHLWLLTAASCLKGPVGDQNGAAPRVPKVERSLPNLVNLVSLWRPWTVALCNRRAVAVPTAVGAQFWVQRVLLSEELEITEVGLDALLRLADLPK